MIVLAGLSQQPLSLEAHSQAVAGPTVGAIATFEGTVRDHDPAVTGTVTHLEYSAHPDAADHLSWILAAHDSPGLRIALTHRLGLLAVGEAAIVVAVASSHRAEALAGVTAILEAVKRDLPVWKREILADGSHTWLGIT